MIYKVRSGKTCISTWKDQIKSQMHTWKTPLSNKITHKDTFATIVNTDWDTFTGWRRTQAIHTLSVVYLEKPEMGTMAKALFGYFQGDFRQLSSSVQFSSVAQLCLTLCDPMDHSMPGLLVHHQLLESTQTHVHWVGDAIQPSHPLSSPPLPAFNLSQHQGLFQWVSSSHEVAKVLAFQLQHQSFQWIFRTDLL